jgi:hypothetical protein
MAIAPTQIPKNYDGKRYSGIYSVSGTTIIARIPGVGSLSTELDGDETAETAAHALLEKILDDAKSAGTL